MRKAAVALILCHADCNAVERVFSALQGRNRLADDHLRGEAGVVVHIFFADLNLLVFAHRKRERAKPLLTKHARKQFAESRRHIRNQHRAHFQVFFAEFCRVCIAQIFERQNAFFGSAFGNRFEERFDADIERICRPTLIEL